MTTIPDVTVVVAVYNTMPALTECLDSLVGQTIGHDRMEIIAVDDGSTDGSGEELDRYAALHPGTVKVLHQANSGGPAGPSNRALDEASGRFVFFTGADDYLGPEALERMVAMADRNESDVVIGKMVAVGDRSVPRAVFRSTEDKIELVGSGALYAISNTKLYRRALVEKHGMRFSEGLPVSSDMPFTLEAYVHATTVSVVADYDCYYAVRRPDDSNITYRARFEDRLQVCRHVLDLLDRLAGPGELYDEFALRLLKVDLAWIFGENYLAMDPVRREECVRATADFLEEYYKALFVRVQDRVAVPQRLRFHWIFRRDTRALTELVRADTAGGALPPTYLDGGRAYAAYPGFRASDDEAALRAFQLLGPITGRLGDGTRLLAAEWEQRDGKDLFLAVTVRIPVLGDTGSAVVRLRAGALPKSVGNSRRLPSDAKLPAPVGEFVRTPAPDGTGTVLTARIPLPPVRTKLGARVYVDVAGSTYEIPVRTRGLPMPLARRWGDAVPYRASANVNPKGRLVITTAPLWEPTPSFRARVRSLLPRFKRKVIR
ncbi:glycosyltransferase family 2 protein [Streptomyces sp. NPDC057137]|uniref:glycosyltransferase family 2 protein n=1 Tax=Streptomyces sp. NPDC057137 TaxID=3346030 RepID=UPI00364397C6